MSCERPTVFYKQGRIDISPSCGRGDNERFDRTLSMDMNKDSHETDIRVFTNILQHVGRQKDRYELQIQHDSDTKKHGAHVPRWK